MADLDAIRDALSDEDQAEFIRAMARATKARTPGLAELARSYLSDDRPNVRNTAALALKDLRDPKAPALIRAALVRPGVAAQSGTLIFALREMAGRIRLEEAVIVVEHGSFEARGELIEMLVLDLLDMPPDDEIHPIAANLRRLTERDDGIGWAAEALLERIGHHAPGSAAH